MAQHAVKHQHLLLDLKNTVESLLVAQVANVWSIYGGLARLHSSMEKIFRHCCKTFEMDYLNFIQGLEWLQPEHSKSYFAIDCEFKNHLPPHLRDDKCAIWLWRSLENHSLSQKLSWLLSDKTHLLACYQSYAFLCQERYAEATLICLRAVEQNQPSLVSEIDPRLFVIKGDGLGSAAGEKGAHRRCSSYPDARSKTIYHHGNTEPAVPTVETKKPTIRCKLKPWHSLPTLLPPPQTSVKVARSANTTPSTPVRPKKISPSLIQVDYAVKKKSPKGGPPHPGGPSGPKKIKHVMINNRDIVEHTPPLHTSIVELAHLSPSPRSIVEYAFLPLSGEKDYRRKPKKSFIEDGGMSVLPMATGYFPRPTKGQTLTSFLTSNQFARANAELDRENAHFKISEAIISAMEQIRCRGTQTRAHAQTADERMDESDPEIADLKQRIRLRRRQKLVEKLAVPRSAVMSDARTDTSASPTSLTPDSLSGYPSSDDVYDDEEEEEGEEEEEDDVDEYEMNQSSNLTDSGGLSMSMASLYSEADVLRRPRGAPDGASDVLSAEGVALCLISKFSERQLPRASELEWLVSEEDAPQALLPLPKSWPVGPDEPGPATQLRGTHDWAPPRPQIVLTMHPMPSRKVLMEKQNYRCAGCSMKVAPQYASRFRYCDYLGKYFCTGCHTNQLALIPARILHKWDFTRYPVSSFSYRLLEQMYTDPLFRVCELNKNIQKMSKNLQYCRKFRLGMFYLKDFIYSCKYAEAIQETLEHELKSYIINDPEVYSIDDLVNVRNGQMKTKLKFLVELCCRHTSECKLCLARGFVCEICHSDEIIFPWQMRVVKRCDRCRTCYHLKCCQPEENCPKCCRINKRKNTSGETSKH